MCHTVLVGQAPTALDSYSLCHFGGQGFVAGALSWIMQPGLEGKENDSPFLTRISGIKLFSLPGKPLFVIEQRR